RWCAALTTAPASAWRSTGRSPPTNPAACVDRIVAPATTSHFPLAAAHKALQAPSWLIQGSIRPHRLTSRTGRQLPAARPIRRPALRQLSPTLCLWLRLASLGLGLGRLPPA